MYQTPEGLWVNNSGDEGVRNQQKEYRELLRYFPDKRCGNVWDIGAHIGWFPWYVNKNLRPRHILCVECSPVQISLLKMNSRINMRILEGAVVADDYVGPTVDLYLGKTYSSCDSTYCEVRGRKSVTVPTLRWNEIATEMPDPTVIKLDCEGAEYTLVPERHIPKTTRAIVAEYHYNREGQKEKLINLDNQLQGIGFIRSRPLKFGKSFTKTMHVSYFRK